MTRYQPQLEYARKPPKRRRILVLILGLLVLTALVPVTLKYARSAAERLNLRRLYTACVATSVPPDTLVYDEDPARQKALLALSDYHEVGGHHDSIVYRTIPPWEQFIAANHGRISTNGTIFLGERTTPSGQKRLVGVDITGWSRGGPLILFTYARTFTPVTFAHLPALTSSTPSLNLSRTEGILRFYAGQADQTDRSHFTIRYTLDDQENIIDGWLKDDNTVLLEPRVPGSGSP